MVELKIEIENSLGLHARPAAMLVQEAAKFPCEIFIDKDGMCVNAKSIMGVLMLAAGKGTIVTIRADGEREQEAIESIRKLIKSKFNEE